MNISEDQLYEDILKIDEVVLKASNRYFQKVFNG